MSSSIFGRQGQARKSHDPVEEEFLIAEDGNSREPSIWNENRIRIVALAVVTGCVGLFLLFSSGCMPRLGRSVVPGTTTISKPHLEKYAAPLPSATSSVLDVFQVYQPVLTPDGATDETTLGDGSENTTSLASASSGASCQVLLMDHVFALSYGAPFVGKSVSLLRFV
jgi:hypothetical protein